MRFCAGSAQYTSHESVSLHRTDLPEAAARERQVRLRVVRYLPVCAELSKAGEAWWQVLDKPPGRKPRERADAGRQDR